MIGKPIDEFSEIVDEDRLVELGMVRIAPVNQKAIDKERERKLVVDEMVKLRKIQDRFDSVEKKLKKSVTDILLDLNSIRWSIYGRLHDAEEKYEEMSSDNKDHPEKQENKISKMVDTLKDAVLDKITGGNV